MEKKARLRAGVMGELTNIENGSPSPSRKIKKILFKDLIPPNQKHKLTQTPKGKSDSPAKAFFDGAQMEKSNHRGVRNRDLTTYGVGQAKTPLVPIFSMTNHVM